MAKGKKCKECGIKIGFFNESFKKDTCNKCFAKPVNDLFKALFGLILFIIIIWVIFIPSGDSSQGKLRPLDASVVPVGDSLVQYQITNLNDYPWHNVSITVNEEYSCWSRDILEPGKKIMIIAASCGDFIVFNNIINTISIETDKDFAKYGSE